MFEREIHQRLEIINWENLNKSDKWKIRKNRKLLGRVCIFLNVIVGRNDIISFQLEEKNIFI